MATPAAPTPGNTTARALSTISGPSVTRAFHPQGPETAHHTGDVAGLVIDDHDHVFAGSPRKSQKIPRYPENVSIRKRCVNMIISD